MKEITGYDDLYMACEDGRVFSLLCNKYLKPRTIGKSARNKGWKPYQQVVLYRNGIPTVKMVHRIIANAFIPNENNKPQVNHKDNNVLNNTVENLEWVTASENCRHRTIHSPSHYKSFGLRTSHLKKCGELNKQAKLTYKKANEIRDKYTPGIRSLSMLAEEYHVSKKLILLIIQNKSYQNQISL